MSEGATENQPQASEERYTQVWGNGEVRCKDYYDMTTYQAIEKAMTRWSNRTVLGARPFLENGERGEYEWITGSEFLKSIKQLALALKDTGLQKGDSVGIMVINRPEWQIIDHACSSQGYVLVPIYDSYGPVSCEYIIKSTNCKLIFTQSLTAPFLKEACAKCDCVKNIVILDTVQPDIKFIEEMNKKEVTEDNAISVRGYNMLYTPLMEKGKTLLEADPDQRIDDPSVSPDDVFTIVYTSGTTSLPKGACLSHRNMVAGRRCLHDRISNIPGEDDESKQDTYISYLPLAHILERSVEFYALTSGGRVGYFSGSMATVVKDLGVLKPTVTAVVPRVLSKIYSAVTGNIAKKGFFARVFVKRAMEAKGKEQNGGKPISNFLKNILANVESIFGGRLRLVFNGSAPVNPTIAEYLSRCMGARIYDGYGITEVAGVSFAMDWPDRVYGNVGFVLGDVQYKVKDIPEHGYSIDTNPLKGELCLKGEAVFKGYFGDDESTKRAIDSEGWFHTGDVVEMDENKRIKIIGRVKNVFKLQQGEFVHVEDIESEISTSKIIGQIMVHGTMHMTSLAAIVVPDKAALLAWGRETKPKGYTATSDDKADYEALCKLPDTNALLLKDIRTILEERHRKGYEIPKMIHVTPTEFSVDNNLVTPTMKLKRDKIREFFSEPIAEFQQKLTS
ncbi:putative Long chain acyl-CoA synthetase 6, peroxisomal [Blattamonas nauphoetae]|uniref:Long chain acyl-CoA synthetase 6, peroxisomal n=1 Tax=Blattamonas nauphoetae TaxID=2049346 RepID=A0ABQ9XX58_9EUKA|nr:putative Long chain acyl-CoA synthetase 6, peroxisomal [Blattamonas nauphoetae]